MVDLQAGFLDFLNLNSNSKQWRQTNYATRGQPLLSKASFALFWALKLGEIQIP
jgi:hypothetical protein